jgi:hypothetical protein
MTLWTWWTALAALFASTLSPLALPHDGRNGYPLALRIAAGVFLIVLGTVFPFRGGDMTAVMPALVALFTVGICPILVDAVLDRPTHGSCPAPAGGVGGGGSPSDDGMAMVAATAAAGLAATTATTF